MNILFYLARYPGIGGIENVTSLITKRMIEDGVSVSIVSHLQQENARTNLLVKVYSVPDVGEYYTKHNYIYVDTFLSQHSFDAIIFQDCYAPMERIICPLARKYGVPLYVFEHNSPKYVISKQTLESCLSVKGVLRRLFHPYFLTKDVVRKQYLLKHCTRYLLLSKRYVNEFCELIKIPVGDSRVSYINNPITQVEEPNYGPKENILLCVCRLTPEKQVSKLINLWERLSEQLSDWKMVIVGDGPQKEELRRTIEKKKLPGIELIGYANPSSYYQRSKLFLMMSKFEGWPMTLLESMQYGCVPIVWNSFSAIYDIIDHKENGWIVPNNNTKEFEQAVLFLAKKNNELDRMSEKAEDKVKLFSLENVYRQWKALLNC